MENSKDELTESQWEQKRLSLAIQKAIDVKALFELYAYRIIEHAQFLEQMDNLTREHIDKNKLLEKQYSQQLELI